MTNMYLDEVKTILTDVLSLGEAGRRLTADSPLLGSLPELDSMAVVSLIGALEEHFDIEVADDDISASTFETLGSLAAFVAQKRAA
jgi:acyl carrier protein